MAMNFPDVSSLNDGYSFTIGDTRYHLHKTSNTVFYWSASQAENPDNRYLNKTGDICTGSLQVQGTTSINVTNAALATDANGNIIAGATGGDSAFAKAWLMYNADAKTIMADFNVSSVDIITNGDYTINFETNLTTSNYAVACGSSKLVRDEWPRITSLVLDPAPTQASCRINFGQTGSTSRNEYPNVSIVFYTT